MIWTYEELDQRLRTYGTAAYVRGNKLLKVFFAIIGAGVALLVLLGTGVLSRHSVLVGLMIVLASFGALALYIIVSARAFHRANGVFCQNCGASLIRLGRVLDEAEEDGIEKPNSLECPRCRYVVVKKVFNH